MNDRTADDSTLHPEDELWLRHCTLEARRILGTSPSLTPQQREQRWKSALFPIAVPRADEVGLQARLEGLGDQARLDLLDLCRWGVLHYPTWWVGRSTEPRAAAALLALRLDLLREAVAWAEAEVERQRQHFEREAGIPRTVSPIEDQDELLRRLTAWPPRVGLSVPPPHSEDEAQHRLEREQAQDVLAARPSLEGLLPGEDLSIWERAALVVRAGRWALEGAEGREALGEVLRRHLRQLRRTNKPRWDPDQGWLFPAGREGEVE